MSQLQAWVAKQPPKKAEPLHKQVRRPTHGNRLYQSCLILPVSEPP